MITEATEATTIRVNRLCGLIGYRPDWWLRVEHEFSGRLFVQWNFATIDAASGKPIDIGGRKWFLSDHMTDSEIVGTVFMAALAAEEHECRERFMYKGQRVFGPHLDVDWMAEQLETSDDPVSMRERHA